MQFNDIYQGLISGKEKLALVGLGYVGMPIAVEFAKHVKVIGFDINEKRVNEYRNGIDSTNEVGPAIKNSTVDFTADPSRLKEARFIVVAVPTPVNEDNSPDLRPVEGASRTVGKNLSAGTIVVFESTVYPGVTEDICVPIIEKESGLKCGVDWKIGYSPERINPGDKVHTLTTIRKVVSGMDAESAEEIKKVYDIVIKAGTYPVSNIKTAEAVKVVENSQRDINIAFMNELAKIFNAMGIDTYDVLEAAASKWNFIKMKPGLVGGHCISVDPYYLIQKAQVYGVMPRVMMSARRLNDGMGDYVANQVIKLMNKKGILVKDAKILILGFSFKENCPDTRNTKVADIYHTFLEYTSNITVFDPWAYAEKVKKEYGIITISGNLDSLQGQFDAVILAVAHKEFTQTNIRKFLNSKNGVVYDVKGVLNRNEIDGRL